MPVLSLGKAREALGSKAETYKAAIRAYFEALGYGQQHDSATEGLPIDMIFRPLNVTGAPEAWVEAKDSEISVTDAGLRQEVRGYFESWARLAPGERFDLWIFVRRLKASQRWDAVFGNKATEALAWEWITDRGGAAPSPPTEKGLAQ